MLSTQNSRQHVMHFFPLVRLRLPGIVAAMEKWFEFVPFNNTASLVGVNVPSNEECWRYGFISILSMRLSLCLINRHAMKAYGHRACVTMWRSGGVVHISNAARFFGFRGEAAYPNRYDFGQTQSLLNFLFCDCVV